MSAKSGSCSPPSPGKEKAKKFDQNTFFLNSLQFLSSFSCAGWSGFQTIFLLSAGLTPTQIGLLGSTSVVSKLVSLSLWGIIADATGDFRWTILASMLTSTVTLVGFQAAAAWFANSSNLGTFFLICCVLKILRSVSNAVHAIADSITMREIHDEKQYGRNRMWASAAWAFGSLLVSVLIDATSINAIFPFTYVTIAILAGLILVFMPPLNASAQKKGTVEKSDIELAAVSEKRTLTQPSDDEMMEDSHFDLATIKGQTDKEHNPLRVATASPKKILQSIMTVFRVSSKSLPLTLLLFSCYWFVFCIVDMMPMVQMEKELKVKRKMMGTATFISASANYPMFWFGKWFLAKTGSRQRLFAVCQVTLCLRLVAYGFNSTPMGIWVLGLTHGMCFALPWVICRLYFNEVAKAHTELYGTVQNMAGLSFSASKALGYLVWMALFDRNSSQYVYFTGAVTVGLMLFVSTAFSKSFFHL